MKKEDLCKHDLIPEWCHECKHLGKGTVKEMVEKQNLTIIENFDTWPTT